MWLAVEESSAVSVEIISVIGALLLALLGLVTQVVLRRHGNGTEGERDKQVWDEATAMRDLYRDEAARSRDEVLELRKEVLGLRDDALRMRTETDMLRAKYAHLDPQETP